MSAEETNDQRALTKQVGGVHLAMILIEQAELGSAVTGLQRLICEARSFKLGCGAMHRFDSLGRRVIWSSSRIERLLEFI